MATASTPNGTRSVPRDWHAYSVQGHAEARFDDDRRPISRSHARQAVIAGDVEDNPKAPDANEWRFRHRVDGCDVVVVCGGEQPAQGRYGYRIVTAFVDVVDAREAWVSGIWSEDELQVAVMLQCLNAGFAKAVDGWHGKRVDVYDPIEYHGHLLVWNSGHDDPFCLRCRHESVDGDDWDRRRCLQ